MYCQKCGSENDDSSKYCKTCGAIISEDQPQVYVSSPSNVSNVPPAPLSNNDLGIKIRKVGRILGFVLIAFGLFGYFYVLFSGHGRYGSDWNNECFDILCGIRRALNLAVLALGAILEVLSCEKKA